jgi:CMP-N-acetylneuraminic acid synthetase
MMTNPRVMALIPARGGSKGIPRKNIRLLAGKPLIAWTIATALECKSIERVIVSTDDPEIAAIAEHYGAEVPFLRPAALATDAAPTQGTIEHVLQWLVDHEAYRPDYLLILQPTSPLRTSQDIHAAIEIAAALDADTLVSVSELTHSHPAYALTLDDAGLLRTFTGMDLRECERKYPRRQDLPPAYLRNGAIYLARPSLPLDGGSIYGPETYGYLMPAERSLDIDDLPDFELADRILRERTTRETD